MTPAELVKDLFPGKLYIPMVDAGTAIGLAKQTSYNLYNQGQFPIAVKKQGRKNFVSVLDLIKYLTAPESSKPTIEAAPIKRKRGRPSRAAVRARQLKNGL